MRGWALLFTQAILSEQTAPSPGADETSSFSLLHPGRAGLSPRGEAKDVPQRPFSAAGVAGGQPTQNANKWWTMVQPAAVFDVMSDERYPHMLYSQRHGGKFKRFGEEISKPGFRQKTMVLPMQDKLPKALEREPLVDAVFEVRIKGTQPLGDILPGFLMAQLKPKPKMMRLPAADIPSQCVQLTQHGSMHLYKGLNGATITYRSATGILS